MVRHGVKNMQVLGNGQVQITNNQTGETKVVDPMQLGSISPFLANQYFAYQTMQKALDKSSAAASTGSSDILQGPADNSMTMGSSGNPTTGPNPASFASPIKPKPKQAPVKITPAAGVNQQINQGNQLAQQPQNNTPWLGSQIVNGISNFFKAPQLNTTSTPPGY